MNTTFKHQQQCLLTKLSSSHRYPRRIITSAIITLVLFCLMLITNITATTTEINPEITISQHPHITIQNDTNTTTILQSNSTILPSPNDNTIKTTTSTDLAVTSPDPNMSFDTLPYVPQVGAATSTFHTYFHGSFTCEPPAGCSNQLTMTLDGVVPWFTSDNESLQDKQFPQAAMLMIYFYRGSKSIQDPFFPAHNSIFKLMENRLSTKRPFSSTETFSVLPGEVLYIYGEVIYTNPSSYDTKDLGPITYTFGFTQPTGINSLETQGLDNNNNNVEPPVWSKKVTITPHHRRPGDMSIEESLLSSTQKQFYPISTPLQKLYNEQQEQSDGDRENNSSQHHEELMLKQQEEKIEETQLDEQNEIDDDDDNNNNNSSFSSSESLDFAPPVTKWTKQLKPVAASSFFNLPTAGDHTGIFIDAIRLVDEEDAPDDHVLQIRISRLRVPMRSFRLSLIGNVTLFDFRQPGLSKVFCTTDYGREFSLQWFSSKVIEGFIYLEQAPSITLTCPQLRLTPLSHHSRGGIYASFQMTPRVQTSDRFIALVPVVVSAQHRRRFDFGQSTSIQPLILYEPAGYTLNSTTYPDVYLTSVHCKYKVQFPPIDQKDDDGQMIPTPLTQQDVRDAKEKFKLSLINSTPISQIYTTIVESRSGLVMGKFKTKTLIQGVEVDKFFLYEPFQVSNNLTHIVDTTYYINVFVPLAYSTNQTMAAKTQCQIWYESLSVDVRLFPPKKQSFRNNNNNNQQITPIENDVTPNVHFFELSEENMDESLSSSSPSSFHPTDGSIQYTKLSSSGKPYIVRITPDHGHMVTTSQQQLTKTQPSSTVSGNKKNNSSSMSSLSQYLDTQSDPTPSFAPVPGSDEDDTDFKQFVYDYLRNDPRYSDINNNNNYDDNNNNNNNINQEDKQKHFFNTLAASTTTSRRVTYSGVSLPKQWDIISRSGVLFLHYTEALKKWKWTQYTYPSPTPPPPTPKVNSSSSSLSSLSLPSSFTLQSQLYNERFSTTNNDQGDDDNDINHFITSWYDYLEQFAVLSYGVLTDLMTPTATTTSQSNLTSQSISLFRSPRIIPLWDYTLYVDDVTGTYGLRKINHYDTQTLSNSILTPNEPTNQQSSGESQELSNGIFHPTFDPFHPNNHTPPRPKHHSMESIFFLDPVMPNDNINAPIFFKTVFNFPQFQQDMDDLYITFALHTYIFYQHDNSNMKCTATIKQENISQHTVEEIPFKKLDSSRYYLMDDQLSPTFPVLFFPNTRRFTQAQINIVCPQLTIRSEIKLSELPKNDGDYTFPSDSNRLLIFGTNRDSHMESHQFAQQVPFTHFFLTIIPTLTIVLISLIVGLGLLVVLIVFIRCCCCSRNHRNRVVRRKKRKNASDNMDDEFFIRLDEADLAATGTTNAGTPRNSSSQRPTTNTTFPTWGDGELW